MTNNLYIYRAMVVLLILWTYLQIAKATFPTNEYVHIKLHVPITEGEGAGITARYREIVQSANAEPHIVTTTSHKVIHHHYHKRKRPSMRPQDVAAAAKPNIENILVINQKKPAHIVHEDEHEPIAVPVEQHIETYVIENQRRQQLQHQVPKPQQHIKTLKIIEENVHPSSKYKQHDHLHEHHNLKGYNYVHKPTTLSHTETYKVIDTEVPAHYQNAIENTAPHSETFKVIADKRPTAHYKNHDNYEVAHVDSSYQQDLHHQQNNFEEHQNAYYHNNQPNHHSPATENIKVIENDSNRYRYDIQPPQTHTETVHIIDKNIPPSYQNHPHTSSVHTETIEVTNSKPAHSTHYEPSYDEHATYHYAHHQNPSESYQNSKPNSQKESLRILESQIPTKPIYLQTIKTADPVLYQYNNDESNKAHHYPAAKLPTSTQYAVDDQSYTQFETPVPEYSSVDQNIPEDSYVHAHKMYSTGNKYMNYVTKVPYTAAPKDQNILDDTISPPPKPSASETYTGIDSYSAHHVQGLGSGGYYYHSPYPLI